MPTFYRPISRRTTLGLLGSLAAIPVVPGLSPLDATPAMAQGVAVRMDLGTFVQDGSRVASLIEGFRVMRARAPSDPTSWFFQAAVHGVTPQAVADAEAADPGVASVNQGTFWNQCPHFGQTSANFLLWHRAYLHYFERILRDAAGDPDLTLPYWNYLDPAQRTFPSVFAPPTLDAAGTPNPLHHPQRDVGFAFGVFQLSEPVLNVVQLFAEPRFFGRTDEEGFAGGNADTDRSTQGLIERNIHNLIHFAVGGSVGTTSGAMGSVPTAAFDPIFWVHHTMIDKLWVDWLCAPARQWGELPDDDWFDETPWSFHDETGTVQTPSRRSMMDHLSLGYAYDTDDPNCTPLALPPSLVAAANTTDRRQSEPEILATIEAETEIRTEPFVVELAGADLGPSLESGADGGEVMVEITGIRIVEPPLQGYDVYLLDEPEAPADRSSPGFLGTLALFGLDHHAPTHDLAEGSTQRFHAGAAVANLADPASAVIVVRPFNLLAPSDSPATAPVDPEIVARRTETLGSVAISAIRILKN